MKERIQRRFTSHVSRLTNRGGFTLIELAIVLVIIGIILGAILKGQDLIESARHKKFGNEVKKWETFTWAFYDRKGYFPGDSDKDGKISGDVKDDLTTKGRFLDPPTTNSITLGTYTFYLWLGNDGSKNIFAATNTNAAAAGVFTDPELGYMEAVDTAIDGSADGTAGRVFGSTAAHVLTSGTWLITGAVTSAAWSTSVKSLVYYFDRKP